MDLTLAGAVWLAVLGLVLRVTAGRTGERGWRMAWLLGLGLGTVLGLAGGLTEPTLLDAWVLGGVGGLAATGTDERARRVGGSTALVLGTGLALAWAAGVVAPLPPAGPGPATLLVVLALGAGAVAALALRVLLVGSARALVLAAAGLWVVAAVHGTGGLEDGFWGVMAGLRVAGDPVYLLGMTDETPLGQRLVVAQGEAGLLLLTGALLLLAPEAMPSGRIWFRRFGAVLALGALGLCWGQGFLGLAGTSAAAVEALVAQGAVAVPEQLFLARLDLASILPALVAVAGGLGLVDAQLAARGARAPESGDGRIAAELGLALIAGLVLVAGLYAVWREVWGSPLWHERGSVLLAMALLLLGVRVRLGVGPAASWMSVPVLWAGVALLAGAY